MSDRWVIVIVMNVLFIVGTINQCNMYEATEDIKTKGALSLERRKKYLQTRIDYWISRDITGMPKGAKA